MITAARYLRTQPVDLTSPSYTTYVTTGLESPRDHRLRAASAFAGTVEVQVQDTVPVLLNPVFLPGLQAAGVYAIFNPAVASPAGLPRSRGIAPGAAASPAGLPHSRSTPFGAAGLAPPASGLQSVPGAKSLLQIGSLKVAGSSIRCLS